MFTLEYRLQDEPVTLQVPDALRELTGDQFRAATKMILEQHADNRTLSLLTGMPLDAVEALGDFQRHSLESMFDYLYHINLRDMDFKEWKIGTLDIGGVTYYGPSSNFGNITWQEFVYVDQCVLNDLWTAAVAALYRPERNDYNGETDRRIPFTTYGTTARFPLFEAMEESDRLAVILNYRAMRRAALELVYPEVFPFADDEPDATDEEDNEPEEDEKEEEQPAPFSWMSVHRSLLGDRIEEEEKFLNLSVHTVLHRLNSVIQENRQRRK